MNRITCGMMNARVQSHTVRPRSRQAGGCRHLHVVAVASGTRAGKVRADGLEVACLGIDQGALGPPGLDFQLKYSGLIRMCMECAQYHGMVSRQRNGSAAAGLCMMPAALCGPCLGQPRPSTRRMSLSYRGVERGAAGRTRDAVDIEKSEHRQRRSGRVRRGYAHLDLELALLSRPQGKVEPVQVLRDDQGLSICLGTGRVLERRHDATLLEADVGGQVHLKVQHLDGEGAHILDGCRDCCRVTNHRRLARRDQSCRDGTLRERLPLSTREACEEHEQHRDDAHSREGWKRSSARILSQFCL